MSDFRACDACIGKEPMYLCASCTANRRTILGLDELVKILRVDQERMLRIRTAGVLVALEGWLRHAILADKLGMLEPGHQPLYDACQRLIGFGPMSASPGADDTRSP